MARNELIRQALAAGAGWVCFIDDDHVFPRDVLIRLLKRDRDLVVPAVLSRWPPHELIAWPTFDVDVDATDQELREAMPVLGIVRTEITAHHKGLMHIGMGALRGAC